jgi:hypothetical protein
MIHVALDLGSESMAAYYDDPASGKSGMIKLQDKATKFLPGTSLGEIEYLFDARTNGNAEAPSSRFWNRISLVDGAQPVDPTIDHATMMLPNSNNEKSLFEYFRTIGSWARNDRKMPNPKILFQHQIKEILPTTIQAKPTGHVNLTPELIVTHLSLQVILNFVLNSKELKNADRKNDILLTLTVPNVYSLPHAESLRKFIRDYAGVHDVQILSESDAVAYFVLTMDDENDPQELKDLKAEMDRIFKKRKRLCLVTLDVGKGTTDLSCVLVEEPRDRSTVRTGFIASLFGIKGEGVEDAEPVDTRRWHSVQGKTGKCTGGNYLNYIFAKYYDDRLKAVAPVLEDTLKNASFNKVPFGFIHLSGQFRRGQGLAIYELERLIEGVKRSITEKYEIELAPERQWEILDDVVDEILQAADVTNITDKATARAASQYADFRHKLKEALTLPQKLHSGDWHSIFSGWLKPRADPRSEPSVGPSQDELSKLKRELELYVRQNVDETFDSLRELVKEHQGVKHQEVKGSGEAISQEYQEVQSSGEEISQTTCVVVSGQGAQFKPIQLAVKSKCKELNIKQSQLYMLPGVQAKEACCKGVISYRKNDTRHINDRELHGTYGCLATGRSTEPFKAFNMTEVKTKGSHTISFKSQQQYYIIFTPRSYKEVVKSPPKRNDGATAFIKLIEGKSKFTLRYDSKNLQLWINNEKLDFAGFGDVNSSIYPKVWPEILEPTD